MQTQANGLKTWLRTWWIASRPLSWPASTMPVIFGTAAAVTVGGAAFKPVLFFLALVGMVLLHSAANMLGDMTDFVKGLDVEVAPMSGGVVRRLISPRQALWGALTLFGAGGLIGLVLAWRVSPWLLVLGGVGIAIGVLYTRGGKAALKYHALGDLAVFLDFGIFGCLGAWTVQTGSLSWVPVVWAVPIALLIVAILHANNWRDIPGDTRGRIATVASLLGDRRALTYYILLLFVPFAMVLTLILVPGSLNMSPLFLVTLLALPRALQLVRRARARRRPARPLDFVALDGATAQLNLLFGICCTLALLAQLALGLVR